MSSGVVAAAVLSMLDVCFVACGINLAQTSTAKGIVMNSLKDHILILFSTVNKQSVIERLIDFSVNFEAGDGTFSVPEPRADEPLLVA